MDKTLEGFLKNAQALEANLSRETFSRVMRTYLALKGKMVFGADKERYYIMPLFDENLGTDKWQLVMCLRTGAAYIREVKRLSAKNIFKFVVKNDTFTMEIIPIDSDVPGDCTVLKYVTFDEKNKMVDLSKEDLDRALTFVKKDIMVDEKRDKRGYVTFEAYMPQIGNITTKKKLIKNENDEFIQPLHNVFVKRDTAYLHSFASIIRQVVFHRVEKNAIENGSEVTLTPDIDLVKMVDLSYNDLHLEVNHMDCNHQNNSLFNIELVTKTYNMIHAGIVMSMLKYSCFSDYFETITYAGYKHTVLRKPLSSQDLVKAIDIAYRTDVNKAKSIKAALVKVGQQDFVREQYASFNSLIEGMEFNEYYEEEMSICLNYLDLVRILSTLGYLDDLENFERFNFPKAINCHEVRR